MAEDIQHPEHPGVADYVSIGVILAVITAIEVGLFFVDVSRAISVPTLLFLTVLKFVLVVGWFMHLRFDNRLFRRLLLAGVFIALVVFGVVGATFYFGPL